MLNGAACAGGDGAAACARGRAMPAKTWRFRSALFAACGLAVWGALFLTVMARLWKYEGAAGAPAQAPITWPASSHVHRAIGLPTLVVFMHPQCPCSRASVEELAKLMTRCQGKLAATVLMILPDGEPSGWEKTSLWTSAAQIPGVSVITDANGIESSRFGAATSGQTLLYSAGGDLLFAGGITESRGHSGDNAGRSLAAALALGEIEPPRAPTAHTPVFG